MSYLNGLLVFPTFFNLRLNLAIRSSWSEPQSAPGLVFDDSIELLHHGCKEYNQSDFSMTIWCCPCVDSSLVLLEEGVFAMTSVFSWQNSVSLFPASFCTPRPNLPDEPNNMKNDSSWLVWSEGIWAGEEQPSGSSPARWRGWWWYGRARKPSAQQGRKPGARFRSSVGRRVSQGRRQWQC